MNNTSFSQIMEDLNPYLSIQVNHPKYGHLGYLVIDRPINSSASGGVRYSPDVSPAELAALARSMTCKWAFINSPLGGAKAGICADPKSLGCERSELMEAFGESISNLVQRQIYYPGLDLGTTMEDLYAMMRGIGKSLTGEQIDTAYATALTVFQTIKQITNLHETSLVGLMVALEGFGKVGSTLAQLLVESGAKIIGISTIEGSITREDGLEVSRLVELKKHHGDDLVRHYSDITPDDPSKLYNLPVDLLIPGARPWAIRNDNISQIQAQFIVPISNAPVTQNAENLLNEDGIIYVPDFVANCGGILASAMNSYGFSIDDVKFVIEGAFSSLLQDIFRFSKDREITFSQAAYSIASIKHFELKGEFSTKEINRWQKLQKIISERDWIGIKQRLAWRIYQRSKHSSDRYHQLALDRYAEMTFGLKEYLDNIDDFQGSYSLYSGNL